MNIIEYSDNRDREKVKELWVKVFNYKDLRNNPDVSLNAKLDLDDGLLWVCYIDSILVGTIMVGYDGHRGWIYSLAVDNNYRKKGLGKKLLLHGEKELLKRGCLKINLQILESNTIVRDFYEKFGYKVEPRISMGKVPELVIRKTVSDDLSSLNPIMVNAFNEDTSLHTSLKEDGPKGYDDGSLLGKIYSSEAFNYTVIFRDKVAGFVSIKVNNRDADLDMLFLGPETRGHSLGLRVWNYLEDKFDYVTTWYTATPEYSKRNNHFYINKCGFIKYETKNDTTYLKKVKNG